MSSGEKLTYLLAGGARGYWDFGSDFVLTAAVVEGSTVSVAHKRTINTFFAVTVGELPLKGRKMEVRMTDDETMTFGKHEGKRMGDVPDVYIQWFVEQRWRDTYPAMLDYAIRRLGLETIPVAVDNRPKGPAMPPTAWITGRDYVKSDSTVCPF